MDSNIYTTGPTHQIQCKVYNDATTIQISGFKVLTANREKIDQEAMKERNALYWPISALRVLLKTKNNPEVRLLRA